jgi:hypothetical protein
MVDEKKPDAENANDAKTPAGETAKDISKAKVDDNHFDEDDDFEEFPANGGWGLKSRYCQTV